MSPSVTPAWQPCPRSLADRLSLLSYVVPDALDPSLYLSWWPRHALGARRDGPPLAALREALRRHAERWLHAVAGVERMVGFESDDLGGTLHTDGARRWRVHRDDAARATTWLPGDRLALLADEALLLEREDEPCPGVECAFLDEPAARRTFGHRLPTELSPNEHAALECWLSPAEREALALERQRPRTLRALHEAFVTLASIGRDHHDALDVVDPSRGALTLRGGTRWRVDADDLAQVARWRPGDEVVIDDRNCVYRVSPQAERLRLTAWSYT